MSLTCPHPDLPAYGGIMNDEGFIVASCKACWQAGSHIRETVVAIKVGDCMRCGMEDGQFIYADGRKVCPPCWTQLTGRAHESTLPRNVLYKREQERKRQQAERATQEGLKKVKGATA